MKTKRRRGGKEEELKGNRRQSGGGGASRNGSEKEFSVYTMIYVSVAALPVQTEKELD